MCRQIGLCGIYAGAHTYGRRDTNTDLSDLFLHTKKSTSCALVYTTIYSMYTTLQCYLHLILYTIFTHSISTSYLHPALQFIQFILMNKFISKTKSMLFVTFFKWFILYLFKTRYNRSMDLRSYCQFQHNSATSKKLLLVFIL